MFFFRRTRSSNKRWRPQTICSRASIVFIQTNPAKIQIYRQLLLAPQIPRYLTVFGLPTSNTEYCQIPPNTIWELPLRERRTEKKKHCADSRPVVRLALPVLHFPETKVRSRKGNYMVQPVIQFQSLHWVQISIHVNGFFSSICG